MLKLLILICASVLQANALPDPNLDNSILDEILRNARSDMTDNDILPWPEMVELPEIQNYRNTDRNQFRKKQIMHRKTLAPVKFYKQQGIKVHVVKRQRNGSNTQRLVVCHFKLCNVVGKTMPFKKSFWREVEQ